MNGDVLPSYWISVRLHEIVSKLVDGSHNPPEKKPDGLPMLSAINIAGNQITFSTYRLIDFRVFAAEDRRTSIEPGDVLLTIVGAIGRAAVVPPQCAKFTLQRSVAVLSPVIIDPKFLMHQLELPRLSQHLKDNARGTAQKGVYLKTLGNTEIWLPPLAEQHRIVAKIEELFSELDKGVESLTTAQEQLKAYRQAVLKSAFEGKLTADWREENPDKLETSEALLSRVRSERDVRYAEAVDEWQQALTEWRAQGEVGKKPQKPSQPAEMEPVSSVEVIDLPKLPLPWIYVRLSTIAQIGSGMSVSKDRELVDPVEVPYLRVANVQRGRLDLSQVTSMKIERTQLSALALKMWDVLFNEGGDRDKLGRGWIWEQQLAPCITQNHVFRASPYMLFEAHAKFISYWGNTYGQKYFDTEGKQTTNLASINRSVLSAFPVPFIPVQEQVEIVRLLESKLSLAETLEGEISAALHRLEVLRKVILKEAFSGRLVAQDPNDEPASVLLERIRAEREDRGNGRKKNNNKKEAA